MPVVTSSRPRRLIPVVRRKQRGTQMHRPIFMAVLLAVVLCGCDGQKTASTGPKYTPSPSPPHRRSTLRAFLAPLNGPNS